MRSSLLYTLLLAAAQASPPSPPPPSTAEVLYMGMSLTWFVITISALIVVSASVVIYYARVRLNAGNSRELSAPGMAADARALTIEDRNGGYPPGETHLTE